MMMNTPPPAGASTMEAPFHVGQGPLPSGEKGLDGCVRLVRKGTTWIAAVKLMTTVGPIMLSACADEKTMAGLLQLATQYGGAGLAQAVKPAVRVMAQQDAKRQLGAKIGAMPSKSEAANRLYTRLVQKDPEAWRAMQVITTRAQSGDQKAKDAWNLVLQAHARRHQLGWGSGTPAKIAAAMRIYNRMRAGDKSAWGVALELAKRAGAGDVKAQEGWGILAQVHEQAMTQAKLSGAAVSLTSARVVQLVGLANAARMSAYHAVSKSPLNLQYTTTPKINYSATSTSTSLLKRAQTAPKVQISQTGQNALKMLRFT